MILDATAGNRTMWISKHSNNIIYIDSQTKLQIKPTIFCDNSQTPFRDKTFDTIFYDPPHAFGEKGHYHSYPKSTQEYIDKWKDTAIPRYYGWDVYADRDKLARHVYKAQKEFHRILKDDGLLWLKWNEMKIKLNRILQWVTDFDVLLQLYIKAPSQTASKKQTYWICMQKKNKNSKQLTL